MDVIYARPTPHRAVLTVALTGGTGLAVLRFAQDAGFRSIIFALFVNWLLMLWANVVYRTIRPSFGPAWYRSRRWECDGRLYERLGIRPVKRLLRSDLYLRISPTFRFKSGRRMLGPLEAALHGAETSHALAFAIVCLLAVYVAVQGRIDTTTWLLIFNVVVNGYPIMLQRYNRARLERILRR